jgi:hypothetical protein
MGLRKDRVGTSGAEARTEDQGFSAALKALLHPNALIHPKPEFLHPKAEFSAAA